MQFEPMIAEMRRLALQAGDEIMRIYGAEDFEVRAKSDASPVTEADEAADALISAGLRAAFPDIPLVTEEQAATHGQSLSTFLIVDPLDGTKEFVQRRGDFTVNIAYVENGVPRFGVVYAPAKERLFYTTASGGAVEEKAPFGAEPGEVTPIGVNSTPDNRGLMVVASKSHRDAATDEYINRYGVRDMTSAGSSLKFCLVAEGHAQLYPRFGPTNVWDTAAGHAVAAAAGAHVHDWQGKPLDYTPRESFLNPGFRVSIY